MTDVGRMATRQKRGATAKSERLELEAGSVQGQQRSRRRAKAPLVLAIEGRGTEGAYGLGSVFSAGIFTGSFGSRGYSMLHFDVFLVTE